MPILQQIKNKFFESKVARRVIGLFFLASLVPAIITAMLSMNYVSSLLIDNALQQMHKESKSYGMSINDKLVFINTKLKNIGLLLAANELSIKKLKEKTYKEFSILALQQTDGKLNYINTNRQQLPILPKIKQYSQKPYIFSKILDNNKSNVFMIVSPDSPREIKIPHLIVEINSAYLWGEIDSLPFDKSICVLEDSHKVLFCSAPLGKDVLNKIDNQLNSESENLLRWESKGENYLAINWMFYLKTRFNSTNWKIVTSQKESNVLQPIEIFNKLFFLAIALTILIVVLLSMLQIRRSLVPLERLLEGTRRVANKEFNIPVEVHSHDEFEELAISFNSMAERLGLQFNSLSILSEIDQLILSDPSNEKILFTVLDAIKNIAPLCNVSITLMGEDDLQIEQTYFYENDYSESVLAEIRSFIAEDIEQFSTSDEYGHLHLNSDQNIFPSLFEKDSENSAYIFPITIKGTLSALIYLSHEKKQELNGDKLNQIYELVNRLAVAITEAKKDKKLYQQSYYDSLTRLANRQLLYDRLDQEIIRARREDKKFALLFLDLDRFKNVNDSLGHFVGDKLLQLVANRIKSIVREMDTVARLGGDEFVILLSNIVEPIDASIFARALLGRMAEPFYVDSNEIFINVSIGIAIYPLDGADKIELLKNADTAMYRVKSRGRGHYMYFEEQMNDENVERASLERDLFHALENNQFKLCYQPLVDLKTSAVIGVEVLLRWHHPKRGIIPNSSFIHLAEEIGIIEPIGKWVIDTACAQYQSWKKQGIKLERVAINISSRQFLQDDFEDILSNALNSSGMPASHLELEITEGILVDSQIDALGILNKINTMGISLSIDDFGAGYSSFSYLTRFPVRTLKIDRSFLAEVPRDENVNNIISSIITMAHTLNIEVIAVGIESKEQFELLKDKQCNYGQGYYFNPPLSPEKFVEYLVQQKT